MRQLKIGSVIFMGLFSDGCRMRQLQNASIIFMIQRMRQLKIGSVILWGCSLMDAGCGNFKMQALFLLFIRLTLI
jgi:hypothetical protein